MNLTKIFHIAAASLVVALGIASPAQAAPTVAFSAGANCAGAASAPFTPGGTPVRVSLCMTTDVPTCGHTILLQSANAAENGKFVLVTPFTLGSVYSEANSEVTPLPLAINNPPTVADFGGTSSGPVPVSANQLLATFDLAPQLSATNAQYVISLSSNSIAAVAGDATCGATVVPTESPITASFTLNRTANAPSFTSAASTTFSSTTTTNTFSVTAIGNPTPTIAAGALPAGVSFVSGGANSGTGTLSTTALTSGGPYNITFTANGSSAVPQTFTLNFSGQASQSITFTNPGHQTFTSTPLPLTATAQSGVVNFSTATPAVCLVSGSNVTMVSLGQCTINANSPASASYLAAQQAPITFSIFGTSPGAPVIGAGTPGNAQATVAFTAPSSTGGAPISQYTVNCGGFSSTGVGSPLTVTGLTNATPYNCTVVATNQFGTGSPSGIVTVTPNGATAFTLIGAQSRKTHTGSGEFSLPIDTSIALISGNVTVEPRARIIALVATHTIVFQFSGPVTSVTSATTSAGSAAAPTFSNNEVTVVLTGVADKQRVSVGLTGVNGTLSPTVFVGFLVGDVNGTRDVDTLDIAPIRAKSGLTSVTTTTYKFDLNADGAVDTLDISAVRARAGAGI